MTKMMQMVSLIILIAGITIPAQAQNRHTMCELAETAIKTISQKLGDPREVTAQKNSTVHLQCFNAPINEVKETYRYLIKNWDSIFDKKKP